MREKTTCPIHPLSPRYRGRCRDCGREKAKKWNAEHRERCLERNRLYQIEQANRIAMRKGKNYKENPEKYKLSARKKLLKRNYGLSLETYVDMLNKQSGVCAICGKSETQQSNKKGKIDSLRVDHCHKTGKIRGLLCSKCNFGISQFGDDINLMNIAIKYLKNK